MRAPIVFYQREISIEALAEMERSIFLSPHYQRQGDIWPTDKQRLFIDSLLNGYIVPAMYWHSLEPSSAYASQGSAYAVVDGRQRLEALFGFVRGDFSLTADNAIFSDPTVKLDGLDLQGLRDRYGWLYGQLMRSSIPVVMIETDDIDLIEDLFSRLNEGVPLSAAEKRNRGRLLAPMTRELVADHEFFTDRLPFGNRRYRHLDLLAKFMRLEDRGVAGGRVPDLRKADLDRLFDRLRSLEDTATDGGKQEIETLLDAVGARLDSLMTVFTAADDYLGSVGMITVYYAFQSYLAGIGEPPLTRADVERFEDLRTSIKAKTEQALTAEDGLVLEFGTYAQGPTSGSYLSARLRILSTILRNVDPQEV